MTSAAQTNAVMMLTVTNWTAIGTFSETSGALYIVQEGRTFTNTVGVMEHEGQRATFVFKSEPGPTNKVWRLLPTGTQTINPPPLPQERPAALIQR